jgi:hypothetical protein
MTMMNKVIYLLLPLFIMSAVLASAQVTIGKNEMPRTGAGLDLNTDNLGLLLPRIALTNNTMALTGGNTEGLVIYNTNPDTNNGLQGIGVYLWDGVKWEILSCKPDQPGEITFSAREVCPGEEFTLSIDPVENADSYIWTVPAGFTITEGLGSHEVKVSGMGSWKADTSVEAGTFTVCAESVCTNSPSISGSGENLIVTKWIKITGSVSIKRNTTLDLCGYSDQCSGCQYVTRWETSNKTTTSVSSTGVVKGLLVGTAVISAYAILPGSDEEELVFQKSITIKS